MRAIRKSMGLLLMMVLGLVAFSGLALGDQDDNDSPENAEELIPYYSVKGEVSLTDLQDWYSVQVTPRSKVTIRVELLSTDVLDNIETTGQKGSSGDKEFSFSLSSSKTEGEKSWSNKDSGTRDLYIQVRGLGDYSISAEYGISASSCCGCFMVLGIVLIGGCMFVLFIAKKRRGKA